MLFRSIFVAPALAALVNAQSASTTVSQAMPPSATSAFNPGNVSTVDAASWCQAQQNTCPEICGSTLGGFASTNVCDDTTFTYTCICNNGTAPDCTAYIQTLPYFICQATYQQCIENNPNNLQGQANCKTAEQCGTKNATALEAVASAATTSSSATSTSTMASSTASSATKSASAAATSSGAAIATQQQLTTGAFAAVLFAAFKLFL